MHIHLDPLGGLAGDMFLAAMLDAWPDLLDPVLTAIRAAGVPADWTVGLTDHKSHGLTGRRFRVTPPDQPSAIDHGPHAHTAWAALRARLETAPLAAGVKARAIAIFALLAEAEAAVHGTSPDAVTFHEVAAWDSVADIVGAAALIDALAADNPRWSVAPLPLGRGRVQTQHGILPVPAPATVKLLHGFATLDDGIVGERVTPTGAAILRQIGPDAALPSAPLTLIKDGTGFGMRCLETVPNMLRVLVFDSVGAKPIGSLVQQTFREYDP